MDIFVTGAAGYIGSSICAALLVRDHTVKGLAHSARSAERLRQMGVEPVAGSLNNPEPLRAIVRNTDATIHAAATNDAEMAARDRGAVEAILAGVAGTSKKFLYTSGVWVMGNTGGRMVDETAPVNPVALIAWRAEHERLILADAARGVNAVILRPGTVYGRANGLFTQFFQSAREAGVVRYPGSGENHWSNVHIDDLGRLYAIALEVAPAGSVYFAVSGQPVRVRAIAETVAKVTGTRAQSWPVEEARQQLGPLTDALVLDQQVSGERARRELGWHPNQPSVLEELGHGSYLAADTASR